MAYEVTATKKRPQALNELLDQEFVVATLKRSIEQGRIAHAYIFSGPRGVGKTSAARILAKSLNCEKGPTPEPCGVCNACVEITKGNAMDVIEIDGASNTSVNDVREIKDEVLFAPNNSKYKVYIIDEVHMLSNSAFNALLKTIEEPPPYIVFVFATTEIHKVPATIRSRCQQFNFKLISINKIKETLCLLCNEMNIQAEEKALFWIAKEATGSMRDAYTLFDQIVSFSENKITLDVIREKLGIIGIDELNDILEHIVTGNSREALVYTQDILTKGIAVEQFIIELTEYFRNILFLKHDIKKENILGFPADHFSQTVVDFFEVHQIELAIEMLLNLYRNIRYSLNQRFELELLVSKLSCLKNLVSRQDLLFQIREIKSSLLSGNVTAEEIKSYIPAASVQKAVEPLDKNGEAVYLPVEQNKSTKNNFLGDLIKEMHKDKKMAITSSLEKVESWTLTDKELILTFSKKNNFSGDLIKKERASIINGIKTLLSKPLLLTINYSESVEKPEKDENKIEMIKDIFNGEIVNEDEEGDNDDESDGSY